jgi:hypothetical protein
MNIERYSHVMHISSTVWFFFCVDNIFMTSSLYFDRYTITPLVDLVRITMDCIGDNIGPNGLHI